MKFKTERAGHPEPPQVNFWMKTWLRSGASRAAISVVGSAYAMAARPSGNSRTESYFRLGAIVNFFKKSISRFESNRLTLADTSRDEVSAAKREDNLGVDGKQSQRSQCSTEN